MAIRFRAYAVAGMLVVVAPGTASAERTNEKAQCAAAYEKSQEAQKSGRLLEARERLSVCVRDVCASFIRSECAKWLEEVEAGLPTVVLAARDANGQDVVDVSVSVDGRAIAERLTGTPIAVDPGMHKFSFQRAGEPPIERTLVVRAGEKNRQLAVRFGAPESEEPPPAQEPAATPAETEAPSSAPPAKPKTAMRTVSYIVGGIGVLALGSWAYFGLTGKKDESALDDRCPDCTQDEIDDVHTKYVIADISLGVGIVCLGSAAWLFFSSAPKRTQALRPPRSHVELHARPTRGGGFVALTQSF